MDHPPQGANSARIVLGIVVLIFVVTLIFAALLLPDQVNGYAGPALWADVQYQRWQYLIGTALGAFIFAWMIGIVASSFAAFVLELHESNVEPVPRPVATWVATWVVGCCISLSWLTVWLPNDRPALRSMLELCIGLLLLAGVGMIVWWTSWRGPLRDAHAARIKRESGA